MVKYRVVKCLINNEYAVDKVEIDRETDKSVFIGKTWYSNKNYFDLKWEAKAYASEKHTHDLRNTINVFMAVKDLGSCGFELYDNKLKKMKPCGSLGCVVTNGIHLCTNHFKSAIGAVKSWDMFDFKEEKIITINRFLKEIDDIIVIKDGE